MYNVYCVCVSSLSIFISAQWVKLIHGNLLNKYNNIIYLIFYGSTFVKAMIHHDLLAKVIELHHTLVMKKNMWVTTDAHGTLKFDVSTLKFIVQLFFGQQIFFLKSFPNLIKLIFDIDKWMSTARCSYYQLK